MRLEETELGKAFMVAHNRMLAPGRNLEPDTLRMIFADFECPHSSELTDVRVQIAMQAAFEEQPADAAEAVAHVHMVMSGLFLEALLTGLLMERRRARRTPADDS